MRVTGLMTSCLSQLPHILLVTCLSPLLPGGGHILSPHKFDHGEQVNRWSELRVEQCPTKCRGNPGHKGMKRHSLLIIPLSVPLQLLAVFPYVFASSVLTSLRPIEMKNTFPGSSSRRPNLSPDCVLLF